MTYSSIQATLRDTELVKRLRAGLMVAVWTDPALGDTYWGQRVKIEGPDVVWAQIVNEAIVRFEAAYLYALEHPGDDGLPSVAAEITDADIYEGAHLFWPADP